MLKKALQKKRIDRNTPQQSRAFLQRVLPPLSLLTKYFRYKTVHLENLPRDHAAIVVMNHGVIPLHGFLLGLELIKTRNQYPKALAASFLFEIPFIRDITLKLGWINASKENAKKLLSDHTCLFVAPGGIYEGLTCNPDMEMVPWENRRGFVREALKAQVPIIPTYGHGVEKTYLNSNILIKLRLKVLELTRMPIPLFFGLGTLPFPARITHYIGKPIPARKRKGESEAAAIKRIHKQVLDAMQGLMEEARLQTA